MVLSEAGTAEQGGHRRGHMKRPPPPPPRRFLTTPEHLNLVTWNTRQS